MTDARVGKRTLAVRFGRTGALVEYATLLLVAYAVPLGLAIWGSSPARALPLITMPLAFTRMRSLLHATTGPEHDACLAATAQLLAVHGLLFAIGLVA